MAGPLPIGQAVPADGSLPASVLENSADKTFHAYVHVPFCRVRCGYCDFNTYTAQEIGSSSQSSFARDLNAEIDFSNTVLEKSGVPTRKLTTVFFGGGTPSLMQPLDIGKVINKIKSDFHSANLCQFF